MFVLLCTIVVVIVVISLLFHCIFNLIHLFGYPSRKCAIKSVFSVQVVVTSKVWHPSAQRQCQADNSIMNSIMNIVEPGRSRSAAPWVNLL